MSYQDDYNRETQHLKDLLAERERLTAKIMDTQRRVMALATLLDKSSEELLKLGTEMYGQALLRRGRLTDAIRQILAGSDRPLTAKVIAHELERLGFPITKHANPSATINAICHRLVEQGFAREPKQRTTNAKAWERAPTPISEPLLSALKSAAAQESAELKRKWPLPGTEVGKTSAGARRKTEKAAR